MYKYKLVKEVIKEGKSSSVDEIRTEVLKRCNIDDIILYFCNKELLDKMKPKQWSILNIISAESCHINDNHTTSLLPPLLLMLIAVRNPDGSSGLPNWDTLLGYFYTIL